MDHNIILNSIIIIQSLPKNDPQDPRTGDDLFETVRNFPFKFKSFENKVELINVNSKQDLIGTFINIIEQCENGLKPIIHFEIHGAHKDKRGLILEGSNEYVSWDEMTPYLARINVKMKNTLILCLGVCYGSNAELSIEFKNRCPFFLLIASESKIYPNQILESFEAFYKSLLNSDKFDEAMKEIKQRNTFKLIGPQFILEDYLAVTIESLNENDLRNDFHQLVIFNELNKINFTIKPQNLKNNEK